MDDLKENELLSALKGELSQWTRNGDALERTFMFQDFKSAMRFVNLTAEHAEEMNHHPDITVNYNKVRMTLSSHDVGKLTHRDLRLARKINEVASSLGLRDAA